MNILREVRRVNEKSIAVRIRLLLTFSVIFIITTYAWFSTQKDVRLKGLTGDVTAWDVYYMINEEENEFLDKTAVFTIDELYPGMADRTDVVHIYNRAETPTDIKYELISVKVFGTTVWEQNGTNNKIEIDTTANPVVVFAGDTAQNANKTAYPFEVSYTYDKTKLTGAYVQGDSSTEAAGHAMFQFNVKWTYDVVGGSDDQNIAKDALDTQFGKDAYTYYQNEANDPTKAIEVKVRITSSMARNQAS